MSSPSPGSSLRAALEPYRSREAQPPSLRGSSSRAPGESEPPSKMKTENLRAYFGATLALKGVTLPIVEHKVTSIIGPSGCGKSTFIRCLNRMHEVVAGARVEGRVTLEGED